MKQKLSRYSKETFDYYYPLADKYGPTLRQYRLYEGFSPLTTIFLWVYKDLECIH